MLSPVGDLSSIPVFYGLTKLELALCSVPGAAPGDLPGARALPEQPARAWEVQYSEAMRRSLLPVLAFAASLAVNAPGSAQTLAAKPAVFADPVPGTDPSRGELVLGRTTLTAALRIFAVELGDSVTVLRRSANPDTLPTGTEWQVGDEVVRPRHRLDLGPKFYQLYFDRNKRLVAAVTFQVPRQVTREDLMAHYPSLKFEGRRLGPADLFVAPLGSCVSFAGRLRFDTKEVDQLSYVYTCPTKPASSRQHPEP